MLRVMFRPLEIVAPEAAETPDALARARAGDTGAFCELCRSHESRLFRQAMLLTGNATAAAELAQDTLVEAWKSLGRYNGRCRYFTWLCAIMLNRHRNIRRARIHAPLSSLPEGEREEVVGRAETLPDGASTPAEAAERRERDVILGECVGKLPPKHRDVIHLRFYSDAPLEEIAVALGCSPGTVKSRLFHALEKLREMNALAGRDGMEER